MKSWFSLSQQAVSGNRFLRLYSYYSLALALILLALASLDTERVFISSEKPQLMLGMSAALVFIATLFNVMVFRNPIPQIAAGYIFLEIALLSTILWASGGLNSSLSSLLIIPVVIANLLTPGLLGYSVAAWTTLAVFYTHDILDWEDSQKTFNAGLYGILCFMLAWLTQTISQHLNSALDLASSQATSIKRLQRFSQQALMDMPDGIIACDQNHRILFFNHRARQWFQLAEGNQLPATLRFNQATANITIDHETLLVRKVKPSESVHGDYLLEIEDIARLAAEAQQIKLASLGRLSASIAHELRNPLSALRQASQLLSEAEYIKDEERYLTNIIENQCLRVNRIIEDVLQLSRRKQSQIEVLRLKPWLKYFKIHFNPNNHNFLFNIECDDNILIPFDANQLQQVLSNLCSNALRYAQKKNPDNATIFIHATKDNQYVYLDVIDNGGGVSLEQEPHLFEPFHTTENQGTGLGLYLCRELCESNQARISYHKTDNGSCFRISMATV